MEQAIPTEVIVSLVGLLGLLLGAIVNGLWARTRNLAEAEKLKAEADKARAEASRTRFETAISAMPTLVDPREIASGQAEAFARALANVLSRFILMEFLIWWGGPPTKRSRHRDPVDVETFLSFHRKALYAHLSVLADTACLSGTGFEYCDLLRAALYNRNFIDSLRVVLEDAAHSHAERLLPADLDSLSATIENILLRAFEKALSNPKLTLLRSWEGERFAEKYGL